MADLVQCPSCQRSLRVPEEMVGRPVKCPDCGMVFLTVSNSPPAAGAVGSEALPPTPEAVPFDSVTPAPTPMRAALLAPAIALLIVGGLGFLVSLNSAIAFGRMNDDARQAMIQQFKVPNAEQQQIIEQAMEIALGPTGVVIHVFFVCLNLLVLLGAVMMMRRRLYAVCILASVLAWFDLESCCCILGVPAGIWSLVILLRPDVKAMFR